MKKMIRWFAFGALSVLTFAMLTACTPNSLDKAKDKMAKEGYTVTLIDGSNIEGCKGGISAIKSEGIMSNDTLTAYLFESKDAAAKFLDDWNTNVGIGTPFQEGKWVYAGNEDGIEDFTD